MTPRQKIKKIPNTIERLADRMTQWIGSPASIIAHTIVFLGVFALAVIGVDFDTILLALTTVVSLEAIYLAIFIQMTVNRNTQSLAEVEEGIEDIAEDVEEIERDIDEIQEDVEEIQADVEEVEKDLDRLEEEDIKDDFYDVETIKTLDSIQTELKRLMGEIQNLKEQKK